MCCRVSFTRVRTTRRRYSKYARRGSVGDRSHRPAGCPGCMLNIFLVLQSPNLITLTPIDRMQKERSSDHEGALRAAGRRYRWVRRLVGGDSGAGASAAGSAEQTAPRTAPPLDLPSLQSSQNLYVCNRWLACARCGGAPTGVGDRAGVSSHPHTETWRS